MVPAQQGPEKAKPIVGVGVGIELTQGLLRFTIRARANFFSP